MNDFVIETNGLTKRYGEVLAVDELSMNVPSGQVFGLLGPNGSGKTTTMGMLLGLVKPTAGSFSLFDSGTRHLEALRRIGAIVETPSFYPYLSGRDNLAYSRASREGATGKELDDLLEKVGLADRADSRFRNLLPRHEAASGARLCPPGGTPRCSSWTRPTNGMDPAGMAEVRDLIRSLGTGGRTVLLSSHLLHEVEQVCDSVASSRRAGSSRRARSPTWCIRGKAIKVRLRTPTCEGRPGAVGAGLGRGTWRWMETRSW